MDILNRINYYNISGYFHCLGFENGRNLDIERVYKIHEFDRKLRNIIFYVIEEIECYLKTQISYYHAKKYGPIGYMSEDNFNVKYHDHNNFLEIVRNHKIKNSHNCIINHHNKRYDGNIPIWVMVEFFTIGELIHFYKDMKTQDKKDLVKNYLRYPVSFKYVDSWFKCLTDMRNRCAHYSRLYSFKFSNLPKLPLGFSSNVTHRLFCQLIALKFVYNQTNRWNKIFVRRLEKLINEYIRYNFINLQDIGFPEDWIYILRKKF